MPDNGGYPQRDRDCMDLSLVARNDAYQEVTLYRAHWLSGSYAGSMLYIQAGGTGLRIALPRDKYLRLGRPKELVATVRVVK